MKEQGYMFQLYLNGFKGDYLLKAIIFDMDGVLVDSMSYHAKAIGNIFEQIGVEMDPNEVFEREGERTEDVISYLLEKGSVDTSIYDVQDILERYIVEFNRIVEIRVFEGMKRCLEGLKDRFDLAVVSGSDRPIVEDIIYSEFPGIFKTIVTGDDVKQGKPAPDPYLKAAGILGIQSDEGLVVENAPMGVEAAKAAGLCCVAVPTYLDPEMFYRADKVLKDHVQLLDFLFDLDSSYKCAQSSKS